VCTATPSPRSSSAISTWAAALSFIGGHLFIIYFYLFFIYFLFIFYIFGGLECVGRSFAMSPIL
jgi:hypothetical protein